MLTKFQFHCSITCRDILYFVFWLSHLMASSVPNLHNTKILNISGTSWDMTKRKTPFFFTFKGLSNSPIFQYLNFSFHRHFKDLSTFVSAWFKMAPYIVLPLRTLMTNAQVICARPKENISVFRFLWRQHEHKKQNWQNWGVSFGEFLTFNFKTL